MLANHSFYPTQSDGTDATKLQPSDFAADHLFGVKAHPHLAKGDGTTDDTAAIQAAVDAADVAGGGQIYLPAGTYKMLTSVLLPDSLSGRLQIIGEAGTVLKPTNGCFLASTAGTYQNFDFGWFAIDATDSTGSYSLIGSRYNTGNGQNVNWDNVYVHDIQMTALPVDTAGSPTKDIWGIGFAISTTGANHYAKNITVERVTISGGNAGILVTGHGSVNDNLDIDNITIHDCSHIVAATNPGSFACSNFHVGQYARVGRVRIINCYGENSGDDGIEINTAQDALITGCTMKNSYNGGYFVRNYSNPSSGYVTTQRLVFRDNVSIGDNTDLLTQGIVFGEGDYGEVTIDGFRLTAKKGGYGVGIGDGSTTPVIEKLTLRDIHLDYDLAQTISGTTGWNAICVLEYGSGNRHIIDGVHIDVSGTVTGAYTFNPYLVMLGGSDIHFVVRDCTLNWTPTTSTGAPRFLAVGYATGTNLVGIYVDGCSVFGTDDFFTPWQVEGNPFDSTHLKLAGCALNASGTAVSSNNFSMA